MPTNNNNEDLKKGGTSKKYWAIGSKEGDKLEFFPIFETNEDGEVEVRYIKLKFRDEKGRPKEMTFNYLDIYMFMYFTANEELRKNLMARHERITNYIPYDVRVELSDQEKAQGYANRRVELPIDELTMAIARNEAWKLWMKSNNKMDPRAFLYQNKKRKK
jgi:hypothetical protein